MSELRDSAKLLKRTYEGWELDRKFETGIDILERLHDIECDEEGNIYVTTIFGNTVHIFSPDGNTMRKLSEAEGKKFNNPEYLKIHRKTNDLYVADTKNNQVLLLSAEEFKIKNCYSFNEVKEKGEKIQAFNIDEEDNIWVSAQSDGGIHIYNLDKNFSLIETRFFEGIKSMRINSLYIKGNAIYLLVNSYMLDKKNTIYRITGNKINTVYQETKRIPFFFTVNGDYFYISLARDEVAHRDFLKIDFDGNIIYEFRYSGEKIESPAGICFKNVKLYISGMDDGNVWVFKRRSR